MRIRVLALLAVTALVARAIIIDRIAIIVGNSIVKDSDIERDIRVTDFLNQEPLSFDGAARKQSATRLVDQIFIRKEIRIGDYPEATAESADAQLAKLRSARFKSEAVFERELGRYGLTSEELRFKFQWQLTVLNFIDARFKPAAYVSDREVESYYKEHTAVLHREFPGKTTLVSLQPDIRNVIVGEKVNQLFFAWLEAQRKDTKVIYLEAGLE